MIEKGGVSEETMAEKWGFEGMIEEICECVVYVCGVLVCVLVCVCVCVSG